MPTEGEGGAGTYGQAERGRGEGRVAEGQGDTRGDKQRGQRSSAAGASRAVRGPAARRAMRLPSPPICPFACLPACSVCSQNWLLAVTLEHLHRGLANGTDKKCLQSAAGLSGFVRCGVPQGGVCREARRCGERVRTRRHHSRLTKYCCFICALCGWLQSPKQSSRGGEGRRGGCPACRGGGGAARAEQRRRRNHAARGAAAAAHWACDPLVLASVLAHHSVSAEMGLPLTCAAVSALSLSRLQ